MRLSDQRWTLWLLSAASFVAVADTTIVSIALPSLRDSLDMSVAASQWVLNAYALVFGGLLLLLGRVADLYGRRRLFALGVAVFAAGSLVAGLAWDPSALILGRFLQGVGAAGFVPASLSMLTAAFTDEGERSRAIGVYGAMAALGFVVGMVGGGVITELWGWRWIFLVNLPIAALMLAGAAVVLSETRGASPRRQVDVLGALCVTAGLVLVIYALSSAPQHGALSGLTLAGGVPGMLLLVMFVLVERRHPDPLVPLDTLTRRASLVPNGAIALQSMVGIAWLYLLTLYFQDVLHHGPLVTGLLFAPMTVASVVGAPVAGRMTTRVGVRVTATVGLGLVGGGIAAMMVGLSPDGPLAFVLGGMVVGEAGFMLSNVSLTLAATSALDDRRAGLAAGLLNTFTQLGSGWGLAIVAVVVAAALPDASVDGGAYAAALRWGLFTCICFCAVALLLVLGGLRDPSPRRRAVGSRG
jgi:EmrB/QacA subfamily drug resistance transporter